MKKIPTKKSIHNTSLDSQQTGIEQKDNKIEADVIIAYVRETYKNPELALNALDSITSLKYEKFTKEDWNIAKFISARTSYIEVEENYDVDFEEGDWGVPVIVGGSESSIGVNILDKDNLAILRQEIDDIINKTIGEKIANYISKTDRPRWTCQKCGRFLGKELSSVVEIKNLLRDFRIGKYWKCRSCSTNNHFDIDSNGIFFHSVVLD